MKKNIYITYNARYKKSTEKKIKQIEKAILNMMLQDVIFCSKVLTERQKKSNIAKCKKIIKLLILNLIRAIHNDSDLILSLDKNILSKNNVSLKLFVGIIEKLEKMNLIQIKKGFFISDNNNGKRTRLKAKETLKDIIIKATTEYTEDVTVHLDSAKKVKVGEIEKVKLTFKSVDSESTWSCFRGVTIIREWLSVYTIEELKNKKIKLKLNGSKIANIEI